MTELETLEKHEADFWANYRPPGGSTTCGIACPECGAELRQQAGELLLSDPPQTSIFCKCGWSGSMH